MSFDGLVLTRQGVFGLIILVLLLGPSRDKNDVNPYLRQLRNQTAVSERPKTDRRAARPFPFPLHSN